MNTKKCVILGEGGVGKTTLISLLSGKPIPKEHSPTIGVDVEKVIAAETELAVWDLGGQKRFQFMWDDFMKGSNVAIVVTDSSEKNVKETKEIIKKIETKMKAKLIAIANKQDLANRLKPKEVQDILGIPVYGMVAIDKKNKDALLKILSQTAK
ncbi:MAG: ADP-ribosylation factor-like protein [Promethearchaeota archaeon]